VSAAITVEHVNSALAKRAARQSGAFSREQALAFGYSDNQISREIKSGRWKVSSSGVYRLAGTPTTLATRGWLVVLAAGDGALLSHRVAGWLQQIDAVPGYRDLDVSVPSHRRPRDVPGAVVHRAALTRADAAWSRGLPVTSPLRTVVDLARTTAPEIGSRIIGDAVRTQLVSFERVEEAIAALGRKHGVGQARQALRLCDPRLESVLEFELLALARRAGLDPRPQFTVTENGRFIARVDLAVPGLKLALEADGYATHARRPGFERDRERLSLLQAAGWTVLAFTATQIRDRPQWVIDVIRRAVGRLAA
jgi:very-short-patch-repair endonuclease